MKARAGTAPKGAKLALVLDIDETSLSNREQVLADDFRLPASDEWEPCVLPGGPCGYSTWQNKGRDKAIAPTLALFKEARAANVSVFFITGRSEDDTHPGAMPPQAI